MCGRFKSNTLVQLNQIKSIFNIKNIKLSKEEVDDLNKEISPGMKAPIITNKFIIETQSFGLLKWDNKGLIFNSRTETVSNSKFFKNDFELNKCIIPASSYYEWQKQLNSKIKYEFTKEDQLLFLAGFYKIENNGKHFSIITKQATKDISFIHDRMPLLLNKEEAYNWLSNINIQAILNKINQENELNYSIDDSK